MLHVSPTEAEWVIDEDIFGEKHNRLSVIVTLNVATVFGLCYIVLL